MHSNLRPPDVARVVLRCFQPNLYCACYFRASGKNSAISAIAIRFSDPDLLKQSNNLASR